MADYAVVATWGNVTFLGINNPILELRPVPVFHFCSTVYFNINLYCLVLQRNSFQAVIVTDSIGNLTFVLFNYERIEWSASTEFGGDSRTGQSTTSGAKVTKD